MKTRRKATKGLPTDRRANRSGTTVSRAIPENSSMWVFTPSRSASMPKNGWQHMKHTSAAVITKLTVSAGSPTEITRNFCM
ncbi:hypothetical protein D9M68_804740 [compost metagenome]